MDGRKNHKDEIAGRDAVQEAPGLARFWRVPWKDTWAAFPSALAGLRV
jgi:hypothetical protein